MIDRSGYAPKIYIRDSGILHALLNLPDSQTLHGYARVGASWEGFAIEQVLRTVKPAQAFFGPLTAVRKWICCLFFTAADLGLNANSAKLPK